MNNTALKIENTYNLNSHPVTDAKIKHIRLSRKTKERIDFIVGVTITTLIFFCLMELAIRIYQ